MFPVRRSCTLMDMFENECSNVQLINVGAVQWRPVCLPELNPSKKIKDFWNFTEPRRKPKSQRPTIILSTCTFCSFYPQLRHWTQAGLCLLAGIFPPLTISLWSGIPWITVSMFSLSAQFEHGVLYLASKHATACLLFVISGSECIPPHPHPPE